MGDGETLWIQKEEAETFITHAAPAVFLSSVGPLVTLLKITRMSFSQPYIHVHTKTQKRAADLQHPTLLVPRGAMRRAENEGFSPSWRSEMRSRGYSSGCGCYIAFLLDERASLRPGKKKKRVVTDLPSEYIIEAVSCPLRKTIKCLAGVGPHHGRKDGIVEANKHGTRHHELGIRMMPKRQINYTS
jgi:hypothetical protein